MSENKQFRFTITARSRHQQPVFGYEQQHDGVISNWDQECGKARSKQVGGQHQRFCHKQDRGNYRNYGSNRNIFGDSSPKIIQKPVLSSNSSIV